MEQKLPEKMKILVTGAAGFIGSAVAGALAARGHNVVGIDNLNSYYDPGLKIDRLCRDGFVIDPSWPIVSGVPASGFSPKSSHWPDLPYGQRLHSSTIPTLSFMRLDISDREGLSRLWEDEQFDICINLAAQAGVRYSLENPQSYVESNVAGFVNILECARLYGCRHVVYASSSSVYGANSKVPFSESDPVDDPVSLYAATKRSDELLAHVYAGLYGLSLTGLRFFTVYGPWGRPDMAPMLFSEAIFAGEAIRIFNHGRMSRDFTYIDDIARGIVLVAESSPEEGKNEIFNIGRGHPTALSAFISALEAALGRKAEKKYVEMQPGDVERTWADTSRLRERFGFVPQVSVEKGTKLLAEWFLSRHNSVSHKVGL